MSGRYRAIGRLKGPILAVALALLPACSAKPYVVQHADDATAAEAEKIYVASHGWHTGFIVPAEAIQSRLPRLRERFGDTPYLEFGWGDKGFYQAKEITAGLTIQAIFWPTESVMHVVAVPADVRRYFANSRIEELCLSGGDYDALLRFISGSFHQDARGGIVELTNGIYGNSQFYQGEGDYYLMNTCNKWTAKGLKSAGLDISPTFKLTAGSVMSYLRRHTEGTVSGSSDGTSMGRHSPPACR